MTTASCAPRSDVDRTRDHLAQARESLVMSLSTLADDIDRNLTDVETRLNDPTMRPEDIAQLEAARERLAAATDKAAASTAHQLERDDLLPEERESLQKTEAKLTALQARVTMAGPINGTRAIQQRLADLGYKPGKVDGLMGPRTRAAIRAFERDNGMPQTGKPSPAVAAALSKARPKKVATK
jgi:dGTP triphosphohydrolase